MTFQAAADQFIKIRLAPRALVRLDDGIRPETEQDAYAVQSLIHRGLVKRGFGPRVGYKIGCTTPVMQAFLDIHQPCAGGIMEKTVYHGRASLRHSDFARVGIECEIAVRLNCDLPPTGEPYTRESVADAVGCCMVAAEIVDDRYLDFHNMGTPSLMADDFFGAGCVLGDPLYDWQSLNLQRIEGRTLLNGQEVGRGTGDAVLGHPLEAVAWLANLKSASGDMLRAGELILTGSLVETKWPEHPSDRVIVTVDGLGSVEIVFD